MTPAHSRSGRGPGCSAPGSAGPPGITLADEHALLLQQVAVRTEELLTAAEQGRWPGPELKILVDYLRVEVLRQVVDEELLLIANHDSYEGFAGLLHDHVRLRVLVELLAEAAVGEEPDSASRVGIIARDLLAQLERHCIAEEESLAARVGADREVQATSLNTNRPHDWYPLTEGSVIDVGALPADQMVEAVVDRLLRMRRGEQVELRSESDLQQVWERMRWYDPGGYGLVHLIEGPPRWRVLFTRGPAPDR